jgi:3,4-dihydroxy 2-butanone 4-phosphate synthase/GTP cyclohydrolase II
LIGEGTTTGISAQDRSKTILALVNPNTRPDQLGRPGHIFPLKAVAGGVLRRTGHTEATIDLARLAGLQPAGALVEVMNEDGSMARLPQLLEIGARFGIKVISIKDLIDFRLRTDSLIEELVRVDMPTAFGHFTLVAFKEKLSGAEHLALVKGSWQPNEPVLTRVHSSCFTGDILSSLRCDCGEQLHNAMRKIEQEGKGVIVYMNQEGRGIGLINKLKAYQLQEQGLDTVEANLQLGFGMDDRDYGVGAQILRYLGITQLRLLSNNPRKRAGLKGYGLEVTEVIPIETSPNSYNLKYLETKRDKLGHDILNKE